MMFLFHVLSFFKKGDTIQGGTLFKGGHYLRKYGTLFIWCDNQLEFSRSSAFKQKFQISKVYVDVFLLFLKYQNQSLCIMYCVFWLIYIQWNLDLRKISICEFTYITHFFQLSFSRFTTESFLVSNIVCFKYNKSRFTSNSFPVKCVNSFWSGQIS